MSTPHCSFVIYLNNDAAELPAFLQDVRTFFQKFPLQYELIACVESKASACAEILRSAQSVSTEKEKIVILVNSAPLGRAESLRRGLNQAQGAYLLIADPQMATPLGDSFKVLQHLMTENDLNLCWGERLSKKDSPFMQTITPRHRLEHLFNGIFHERNKKNPPDILCEAGGLTKKTWQEIEPALERKLRGWYLHIFLQKALHSTHKSLFIAIHDSGKTSPSYSLWKVRLRLLLQSIF